ncbi:hypothetical protein EG68_01498 [Paragonimus skrjabini miyazakii]|uniref:Uncharacterized protein n=1 Tax=Paragonimus skrjabini miyazakii TaxID=59628 RepID=A0A8S9ZB81_9TREM|nr:hypothetical protein EG68_01498 [Paragonimus skrjabini miyazakii]
MGGKRPVGTAINQKVHLLPNLDGFVIIIYAIEMWLIDFNLYALICAILRCTVQFTSTSYPTVAYREINRSDSSSYSSVLRRDRRSGTSRFVAAIHLPIITLKIFAPKQNILKTTGVATANPLGSVLANEFWQTELAHRFYTSILLYPKLHKAGSARRELRETWGSYFKVP